MDFLIENEQAIRVCVFISLLLILGGAELIAPLAKRQMGRPSQWFTNLSIVLLDNLTLKYLFPLLAVGVAELSAKTGVGLFNALNLNFWLEFGLALFFLDFLIASGAFRDGLICNPYAPAQSKRTFSFSHFF